MLLDPVGRNGHAVHDRSLRLIPQNGCSATQTVVG
jgi:hypothetical protein